MMKPLRKRHLQVWSLFALLIPAVIIVAYQAVPKRNPGGILQDAGTAALPVLLAKKQTGEITATIRRSSDGKEYQLQVTSPEAIVQPSSLIYRIQHNEQELVGRIGAAGDYFFPLKADTSMQYGFVIYDIIYHRVTDSLKF